MDRQKYFYYHLVDLSDIEDLLSDAQLEELEREELLETVNKTIHIEVIHYILNELPEEQKVTFITQVEEKPEDRGIRVFLKQAITNFDEKVGQVIANVKQDFKDAIDDYLASSKEWFSGD